MSAIAGVVRFRSPGGSPREVERMLGTLAHRTLGEADHDPCRATVRSLHSGATMGAASGVATRDSSRGRLVLAADARLDNGDELSLALGHPRGSLADAEVILRAYERWGVGCVQRLVGDFAIAIWDERASTLLLARDAMGVRPLYLHQREGFVAFASEIKALRVLPEVPRAVDVEQAAVLLELQLADRRRTIHTGIARVPAAHTTLVTASGVTEREYWRPDPHADTGCRTADEYREAFRTIFSAAVAARTRGAPVVGATLSGGLDSSSVACVARDRLRSSGTPLHTFSLTFEGLGADDLGLIDERAYIESVVATGGLTAHLVRGDHLAPLAGIDEVLPVLDEPTFAPNLYLHCGMFAAARANGVGVLLDGFDGDSTVSHGYGRLNGLARAGDWETFEREVRAVAARRGFHPQRLLDRFGRPHLAELARGGRPVRWARAARELRRRFSLSGRDLVLRDGVRPLLSTLGARRRTGLTADASTLLHADALRRLAARATAPGDDVQSEAESHVEGLLQPLYQLTLESADLASRAFGVEARYPFFDRRLIDFCVAVPEALKLSDGWPRHLFRRAMEGVLPPAVQWRADKSNLAPNFHRAFRTVDRERVEAMVAGADVLAPWIDRQRLLAMQARYFGDEGWRGREADGYQLFRATTLYEWLVGAAHSSSPLEARMSGASA